MDGEWDKGKNLAKRGLDKLREKNPFKKPPCLPLPYKAYKGPNGIVGGAGMPQPDGYNEIK